VKHSSPDQLSAGVTGWMLLNTVISETNFEVQLWISATSSYDRHCPNDF